MSEGKILGGEDWVLEVQASEGLGREDIEVREVEKDVPRDFVRTVDGNYYENLVQKARDIKSEGKGVQVKEDGDLRPVSVEGGEIFWEDGKKLTPSSWEVRPTLYSVGEDGTTQKEFWDGSTFVAEPEVKDGKLVLNAFEGSYAERLAAKDFVDQYSIDELPLSMNITVVPLMEKDDEKVVPMFRRNQRVAEYPGYLMTVAGGVGNTDIHPLDAGWKEMVEEIRMGPDASKEDYGRRGMVSEREVDTMREGQVDGNPIYTMVGDHGQKNIYIASGDIEGLGVIRNLETHAPEIIASVDTGVEYEIAEENYTRTGEHESITSVPYTKDDVKEFLGENDDIIPPGKAGLVLATGLEDEFTKEYKKEDLQKGYEDFVSLRI